MNKHDELYQILSDLKNQIVSFDAKASTLLTVVGIVFALLTNFANIFSDKKFIETTNIHLKNSYIAFFIIFCLFAFITVSMFILVITPRRKPKIKNGVNIKKHVNYYYDVASMTLEEYKDEFNNYENSDEVIMQQIINNGTICKRKHKFLKAGIYTFLIFGVITFVLFALLLSF